MAKGTRMETTTAIHAYGEYKLAAAVVAARFWPEARMVDARARTRDDYVQELRLQAINAANRFQHSRGFCLPEERRYTYKALWNHARNWRRGNWRNTVSEVPLDAEYGEVLGSYQIDGQLEAREAIGSLLGCLCFKEREVLFRLVESGGNVNQAFDPDLDDSWRGFRKRVARLRRKAKKVMGA